MIVDKNIIVVIIFIILIIIFYLSGLLKFTIVETDKYGNVIHTSNNDVNNDDVNNDVKIVNDKKISKSEYDRKVENASINLKKQLKQLENKFYYDNSRFDLVYLD